MDACGTSIGRGSAETEETWSERLPNTNYQT